MNDKQTNKKKLNIEGWENISALILHLDRVGRTLFRYSDIPARLLQYIPGNISNSVPNKGSKQDKQSTTAHT